MFHTGHLYKFDPHIFSTFYLPGFEEETWLLQNPPCESRQSLLTSFVHTRTVLEGCHFCTSLSNQKDPAVLRPLWWGWIHLQHRHKAAEDRLDEPGPRLNVHISQGQTWNRKTCFSLGGEISHLVVMTYNQWRVFILLCQWHNVLDEGPVTLKKCN